MKKELMTASLEGVDVHCLSTLRRYANDSRIAWLDFLVPVVFVCLGLLAATLHFFILLQLDTYLPSVLWLWLWSRGPGGAYAWYNTTRYDVI